MARRDAESVVSRPASIQSARLTNRRPPAGADAGARRRAREESFMLKSLVLIVFTVIINTAGQFMVKTGVNRVGHVSLADFGSVFRALTSWLVLAGFAVYFLSALLWISILSRAELSWAFPILSLSYVLTALLAPVVLHESFSALRFAGILVICFGVYLVSRTY
jgi:drug/metabolite transporter (DMT)-like permease